jgi:methylated-DNA-[protein]-cysteine S-methyltransferase
MKPVPPEGRPFFTLRGTRFGPVAFLWHHHREEPRIVEIAISRPDTAADRIVRAEHPGALPSSCPEVDRVADLVAAFMAGEEVRLPLDIARMELCPPFQQRVLRAEYAIPRGRVSTYGRIAAHLGIPGASRAVGTALATNPFPILVPCHRAIRADGSLGGYQGGLPMKRALLEMEGIRFDAAGRVLPNQYHY